MQKDFHFYVTYVLARKVGYSAADAKTIAWANEYTDRQTVEDIYEIQTQCQKIQGWSDPQIQMTVLIPFHFIPGDDPKWPWKTTANSSRARKITIAAEKSGDLCRLGIALHALQDTFSHQGFSGWQEDRNACYPWHYWQSALPNVGHTEMMAVPDMVDRTWYDPRTNRKIENPKRALLAAEATFDSLLRSRGDSASAAKWSSIRGKLSPIFRLRKYDNRKQKLRILSGDPKIDYKKTDDRIQEKGKEKKSAFIAAASAHLSVAISTFEGLCRVPPS
jgi:hypothetical protein